MMMPGNPHAYFYAQPGMAGPYAQPMHMSADGRGVYGQGPGAYGAQPQAQPVPPAQQLWPLRMRGLPFDSTELDVAEFFYPLPLAPYGVSLQYHPPPAPNVPPRPKGEAYVAFSSEEVRALALDRHKQLMRTRYIELFEVSEADFAQSLHPAAPPQQAQARSGAGAGGYVAGGVPMGMGAPYAQMGAPMRYAHQQHAQPAQGGGGQLAYAYTPPASAHGCYAQPQYGGQQGCAHQYMVGAGAGAMAAGVAHHAGHAYQTAPSTGKPIGAGAYGAAHALGAAQMQGGGCSFAPLGMPADHALLPTAGYLGEMGAELQQQQPQQQPHHPYAYGYAQQPQQAHGQRGSAPGLAAAAGAPGAGSGMLYVRMRGLPFSATEADVLRFFAPLRPLPNGIALSRGPTGAATGEAHALFASEQDARTALQRNRQLMGQRYVELFLVSSPDAPRARAAAGAPNGGRAQLAGAAM
ncbi:hypothetical protein KFE25_005524 [Diacronema lutheri]|uniref:RRM domain-containing protein n=1 Tax=Diacronema lutheri TaxID=2081491 RepID=A0A8J6CAW9_DIALT|nr:hypothetical protein KFE25_005524 [Diacronema lutheri]